ncbi:hypothetical protein PAPHI01_1799 [Pancytospora philotis]|nr:hypothetical protein PAPHI01_1799 [Pancytospora philotis]
MFGRLNLAMLGLLLECALALRARASFRGPRHSDSESSSRANGSDSSQSCSEAVATVLNAEFVITLGDSNVIKCGGISEKVCVVFPHITEACCRLYCAPYFMVGDLNGKCAVRNGLYYEFMDFPAFYLAVPLTHARRDLLKFATLSKCDGAERTRICDKIFADCCSYKNYDNLRPYLYNLDVLDALAKNKYDTNFMTYFLNVYYNYIDVYLATFSPNARVFYNAQTGFLSNSEAPLSFVAPVTNYHFDERVLGEIFNKIVSFMPNSTFNILFVRMLLFQFDEYVRNCACIDGKGELSTYEAYIITYNAVLVHLLAQLERAVATVEGYKPNFLAAFAAVPFRYTTTAAPTAVPTNQTTFVLIDTAAIDLDKLVLFINQ